MKKKWYPLWIIIAIICAFSFAVVTQLYNPTEKISAIWLVTAAGCFFALAYRFYGSFLAAKVAVIDDLRQTPAYALNDGKNYYPTNKWVLFGHHFAAIAGAGPLIGPVLAAQFGYLPGFLWMVIGAVLAGGVHDFIILFASVRRDGQSLAHIAKKEVGPVSGAAAMFVVLFVMVIAIAGLGLAIINSLFHNSWGVFIIGMTIPIALFMGVYMKSFRPGKIAEISIIGIVLLLCTVIFGHGIPSTGVGQFLNLDKNTLSILLAVYGFCASVLPVWLLLAPRDYLSSFMKIGVIILLALGVLFLAPTIQMPAFTRFISEPGPVIPGKVFPFLFITIACGAISGGHALFASGTTSKMIEKERYILPIGYGAMLTEGFVSVMALIAAGVLIPGDYFAINSKLSFDVLGAMGFPTAEINNLSGIVGVDLAGRPGGAVSLAVGMAKIFSAVPFLKHLMAYWFQFALMFEAFFILTTIDAGTRVCRYIVQELGGHIYKPFGDLKSNAGNLISSLIVVLAWGFFIYTGSLTAIWPMFGTANQLLAMLALCLGTTVIIKMGKAKYAWVTFIPMVFMTVITFTSSIILFIDFIGKAAGPGSDTTIYLVSAILMALILILAVIILVDSVLKWYVFFSRRKASPSPGIN